MGRAGGGEEGPTVVAAVVLVGVPHGTGNSSAGGDFRGGGGWGD